MTESFRIDQIPRGSFVEGEVVMAKPAPAPGSILDKPDLVIPIDAEEIGRRGFEKAREAIGQLGLPDDQGALMLEYARAQMAPAIQMLDPAAMELVFEQLGDRGADVRAALVEGRDPAQIREELMAQLSPQERAQVEEIESDSPQVWGKVVTGQEILSSMSAQPSIDVVELNPSLDGLQVLSLITNFKGLFEAHKIQKRGEALLEKATLLAAQGKDDAAAAYQHRGMKLMRIAYGASMSSAAGISAAVFPVMGGATNLLGGGGEAALAFAGVCGQAAAGFAALVGAIEVARGARNLHSERQARKELRQIQDYMYTDYASLPGTEAEVDLFARVIHAKKHELNLKRLSAGFGVTQGAVGIASAVAAGVASGAATAGLGTVVTGVVLAGLAISRAVAKHKVRKREDLRQDDLTALGFEEETTAAAYAGLYLQLLSEREQGRLNQKVNAGMSDIERQFNTQTAAVTADGEWVVGRGARPQLGGKICQAVFGVSPEAYIEMVEMVSDRLTAEGAEHYPEIAATMAERREGGPRLVKEHDPLLPLSGKRAAQLRLDLMAETDPVWRARLQRAAVTGEFGTRWREGGRLEMKATTRAHRDIMDLGGEIRRLRSKHQALALRSPTRLRSARMRSVLKRIYAKVTDLCDRQTQWQQQLEAVRDRELTLSRVQKIHKMEGLVARIDQVRERVAL